MADAWDYGPGDQSSASLTFADMLSQGSNALASIVNAGNSIKSALGSSSVSKGAENNQSAAKSGVPVWMWLIGAVVVYKVVKG